MIYFNKENAFTLLIQDGFNFAKNLANASGEIPLVVPFMVELSGLIHVYIDAMFI